MKDELQTKLLEILTAIQTNTGKAIDTGTELAGKAGDFALEQLPDIAQSYVAFARAWETFGALLWSAIFAASVYIFVTKVFVAKDWVDRYGDPLMGRVFFGRRVCYRRCDVFHRRDGIHPRRSVCVVRPESVADSRTCQVDWHHERLVWTA